MTPEEALLKAADHIAEFGWHQGALYDHDALDRAKADPDFPKIGGFPFGWQEEAPSCAMGAVGIVVNGDAFKCDAVEGAAVELLRQSLGLRDHSWPSDGLMHPVAKWNDDPNRTAEDVILAMKKAATG
ncbi:DUF6197 family protein [Streptomyces griseus]|uniref:DUF6197 family protein n=1 Tax=Streptomyces griseus TaxID=1911 RepID=UPI0033D03036